ncbi:polyprotein [Passer montanus pegivirus]|nr:polyprotein [Passer montanus pegivirus]
MKSLRMLCVVVLSCFVLPLSGWELVANHACYNETAKEYQLTNCCSKSEVFFCMTDACWVAHGCVICTKRSCWQLVAAGISAPTGKGLSRNLGPGLTTTLYVAYACEGLGAGELCAAVTLGYQLYRMGLGWHPELTCNRSCALAWNETIKGWWNFPQSGVAAFLWEVVLGLPRALWSALSAGQGGLVLLGLIYLFEDRPVKALLMLLLIVFQFHDVGAMPPLFGKWGLTAPSTRDALLPCYKVEKVNNQYQVTNKSLTWPEFMKNETRGEWWCQHGYLNRGQPRQDLYWGDDGLWSPTCTNQLRLRNLRNVGNGTVRIFRVVCQQGSVVVWTWWGRARAGRPPIDVSAVCYVWGGNATDLSRFSLLVSCVVDHRAKWCGGCVRDCWLELGDPLYTYDYCGIGSRLTKHMGADVNCHWNPKTQSFTNDWASVGIPSNPSECRDGIKIKAGAGVHVVPCTRTLKNSTLPWYMPGTPVVEVKKETWFPFMLLGPPMGVWVEGNYYNVCVEHAYRWEDKIDGLIHVNKAANSSRQSISSGVPPTGYFLADFFVCLLILMKLMGARWVPFVVLVIWLQLAPSTMAAPTVVIEETPYDWSAIALGLLPGLMLCAAIILRGKSGAGLAVLALVLGGATVAQACKPVVLVGVVGVADGALFACRKSNCMGVNWTHVERGTSEAWTRFTEAGMKVSQQVAKATNDAWTSTRKAVLGGLQFVLDRTADLLQRGSTQLGAYAAVAGWVGVGPMVSACRLEPSALHIILLAVNLVVYVKSRGFGRVSSMVGFKLYRGWFVAAVLGALAYARRRHSAAGACEICISLEVSGGWAWSWSLALVASYAVMTLASFTRMGKVLKLEWYAKWAYVYGKVYGFVADSPLGWDNVNRAEWIWWGVSFAFPYETLCITVWLYTLFSVVDAFDMLLEAALVVEPELPRIARLVEAVAETRNIWAVKRLLHACGNGGVFLYDHMGQVGRRTKELLLEAHACLEPAFVSSQDLEVVRDDAFILACGSMYGGKPVVARRGNEVLIGHAQSAWTIPPGFKLSAPLLLRREGKNAYRVLLTSMRGRDEENITGQIIKLGTALTRSFGTCLDGLMFTTFHGSNGKSLATSEGPVYPRWTSASADVAVYPMPKGASSLTRCGCQCGYAYALTRNGELCHGKLVADTLFLDTDRRLADFKGASGSPILCDKGHCVGMLVACKHTGPRVHSVRFVRPWDVRPADTVCPTSDAGLPLPSKDYRAEALVANTGSGKSTRIPVEYTKMGYRVLVVNPSVATTVAMLKYIPAAYKITPSVFAGHAANAVSVSGEGSLTYCTYGRLLAGDFRLLRDKDVVILDECHSTDPTVLLGIGGATVEAQKMGVKLLLYATATPPGTHVTAHPNVREEALTAQGDISFYGVCLKSEEYQKGRHLIFCHSKRECEELAIKLTRYRCRAVTYYRGKSIDVIPPEGDVVVIATDALSTGYTGDFDSVTDCCTHIEEVVDIDLAPTICISVRTVPCNAALRLQRRGRTGRGKAGVYRYALPDAPPTGVAPSGSLWSAVEMGVVWLDMPEHRLKTYLDAYNSCPWTCIFDASLDDAVRFVSRLRDYRSCQQVQKMMNEGYSWPLISGVQLKLCQECRAGPPSDDARWKGLSGSGPVPYIATWGGVPGAKLDHPLVKELQGALGVPSEALSTGPALLVGAAVACAAALVNYTGCLVAVSGWSVGEVAHGNISVGDALVEDALTTVETCVSWDTAVDGFRQVVACVKTQATGALHSAQGWWGPVPAQPESWCTLLAKFVNEWASGITAGVAVLTSRSSPVLAAYSMFASGMMSSLRGEVVIVMAALAGAVCTMIGSSAAGLAVAGAFIAGNISGRWTPVGSVFGALCGWEAAVTGAGISFALLNSTFDRSYLTRAITCLANPGAAIAGGAIGIILYYASAGRSTQRWTNRILSAIPRTQALPDGFYDTEDPKEKVEKLLKRVSLVEAMRTLLRSLENESVTECAQGAFWEFIGDLVHWFRRLLEWIMGKAQDALPSLNLPIVHCQTPYTGRWKGSGTVVAKCPCGNAVTLQVAEGAVIWRSDSKSVCLSAFKGGVPINTMGCAKGPVPEDARLEGGIVARFPYGFSDWIEVRYSVTGPELVATTTPELSRSGLMSAVRNQPVIVGGVSRSWANYHRPARMVYTAGAQIVYAGVAQRLPYRLISQFQVTREPGLLADPADSGTDVEMEPITSCDRDSSSVMTQEEYTGPQLATRPMPNMRKLTIHVPGGSVPAGRQHPDIKVKLPDLWAASTAKVRDFKETLDHLTRGAFRAMCCKGGIELPDNDYLPDEFTLKEGTTFVVNPSFDPFRLECGPEAKLDGFARVHCVFTIQCCGARLFMNMPLGMDQTIQDALVCAFEREKWLREFWDGQITTFWDETMIASHVPVINGKVVSWSARWNDPSMEGTTQIELRCNGEKKALSSTELSYSRAKIVMAKSCKCWHKLHKRPMMPDKIPLFYYHGIGANTMLPLTMQQRFGIRKTVRVGGEEVVTYETPRMTLLDTHELYVQGKKHAWTEILEYPFPEDLEWEIRCPFPDPEWVPTVSELSVGQEDSEAWADFTKMRLEEKSDSAASDDSIPLLPVACVKSACCLKYDINVVVRAGETWQELLPPHIEMQVGDLPDLYLEGHTIEVDGSPANWSDVVPARPGEDVTYQISVKCDGLDAAPPPANGFIVRVDARCCDKARWCWATPDMTVAALNIKCGLSVDHSLEGEGRVLRPKDALGEWPHKFKFKAECKTDETPCVQSYIWSGIPLGLREMVRRPPTTPVGGFLRANPGKAYRTDPADIGTRIATVTREQVVAKCDTYLRDAYNAALANASKIKSPGYSYEEAISKVRPRAAPGHNVKLTVKDLKTAKGKQIVLDCLADIKSGRGDHPFCISAKQEVFPMTKKTKKPPRIICYPSLEFRVAEKMILGDPGKVARAVVGKAYGFVSPRERVQRQLEMWRSKKHPMAITVDAKVFDSTITAEDVARETEIYAAASDDPQAVRALGKRYASGPMVNPKGVVVGHRNCRASGVLTTSSSNTITSFIKVSAACRAVGIPDPSFLIAGDDCLIVCEECDLTDQLRMKLAEYGYDSDPQKHYSLTTAETCSSYLSEVYTDRMEYYPSTNMERAIARACSEWSDPIAVAGGYTLLYPTHPVTRWLLMVQLLGLLFYSGKKPTEEIVCEVKGNTVRFPLLLLPRILVGLHGPGCLRVRSDSVKTMAETHKALQTMGCKGLGWYKRRWTHLRVALLRKGGDWAYLARTLMWTQGQGKPLTVKPLDLEELTFMEQPYQGFTYNLASLERKQFPYAGVCIVFLCALAVLLM